MHPTGLDRSFHNQDHHDTTCASSALCRGAEIRPVRGSEDAETVGASLPAQAHLQPDHFDTAGRIFLPHLLRHRVEASVTGGKWLPFRIRCLFCAVSWSLTLFTVFPSPIITGWSTCCCSTSLPSPSP